MDMVSSFETTIGQISLNVVLYSSDQADMCENSTRTFTKTLQRQRDDEHDSSSKSFIFDPFCRYPFSLRTNVSAISYR